MDQFNSGLGWDDHELIEIYFRSLLTICDLPMPRCAVFNGLRMSPFVNQDTDVWPSITSVELEKIAGTAAPSEFFQSLIVESDHIEPSSKFLPVLRHFGIWAGAAGWFKYHSQLRFIERFVQSRKRRQTRIEVQATWNGEDAYSLAVFLDALCRDVDIAIVGRDIVKPNFHEMQWVKALSIPSELHDTRQIYFEEVTNEVCKLKPVWRRLAALETGDMMLDNAYCADIDCLVINGVLGQTITSSKEISEMLQRASRCLGETGILCIDNSAFAITHEVPRRRLQNIIVDLLDRGILADGGLVSHQSGQYVLTGC